MESKNYTQVLIDGKIYMLGGSEDESYLQKAASYVNEKNSAMRKVPGFSKQNADYQQVMTELNIADDYFKAVEWAEEMERQKNHMEKETYSLKHELVSTQMKLEAVLKDLEERQRELDRVSRRTAELEGELKEAKEDLQNLRSSALSSQGSIIRVQAETVEEIEAVEEIKGAGEETPLPGLEPHATEPGPGAVPTSSSVAGSGSDASGDQEDSAAPAAAQTAAQPITPPLSGPLVVTTASTQAAATAAAGAVTGAPFAGGVSDEELARKALQAARKAGSHKGGRR